MKKTNQCVLLYSAFSGTGHHDSWLAVTALALIRKGYRVICLAPDISPVYDFLNPRYDYTDCLQFIKLAPLPPKPGLQHWRISLENRWRIAQGLPPMYTWTERADAGCSPSEHHKKTDTQNKECDSSPDSMNCPGENGTTSYKKKLKKLIGLFVPARFKGKILRLETILKHHALRAFLWLTKGIVDDLYITKAPGAKAQILRALPEARWPVTFLFFMYFDTFLYSGTTWRGNKSHFPLPWGGIAFSSNDIVAQANTGVAFFKQKTFKGMCIPDSEACKNLNNTFKNKFFSYIHDITNTDTTSDDYGLLVNLRRNAAGRKIILMCGSIDHRKNMRAFCKLASIADQDKWFFAIIGNISIPYLMHEDIHEFFNLMAKQKNNVFIYNSFIKDERELNSIIAESNILFCVYADFKKSSNMLSKAAYLNKPILVSKEYQMGALVRQYQIGACVSEDDVPGMLHALEDLDKHPVDVAHFAAYRRDFSQEAFADSIHSFISRSLAGCENSHE